MKRNWNDLDLTAVFHTMPQECSLALMQAARSAVQESVGGRRPRRAVWVVAIVLMSIVAMAFAATELGWADFFGQQYGIALPSTAQETLQATQPVSCQVGPVTFTFQQLLADEHMVLSSAQVQRTDGSDALYADGADGITYGSTIPEELITRYDLAWGSSWLEAAQALDLPLYSVRALVELPAAYSTESMEGALWQADGSIVYFSMPLLASVPQQRELQATLSMYVTQYDLATGEAEATWQAQEPVTLPVLPPLEEKSYLPQEETVLAGLRLDSVQGARYATGVYFTACFTVPDGMTGEEVAGELYQVNLLDEGGTPLPQGLNLSTRIHTDALPVATLELSSSLEALPDQIIVSMDGETVTLR